MKLLWLCNMTPSCVQEKISGKLGGGLWVDHVLSDLRQKQIDIRILCPGSSPEGSVDDHCSYAFYSEGLPHIYLPELETQFEKELTGFCPDVIHIWGTEYGHTLAMVQAAEKSGFLDKLVISIQGLCSIYAGHYAEGVPYDIQRSFTFRDAVKQDNICQQQKKFALRGDLEIKALQKAKHVIGRTDWDKACTELINPQSSYHFCNETLREAFYEGTWRYCACRKHRIFASSCAYPIKGFHYLLEAFAEVRKTYPDATLAVPGASFVSLNEKEKLRQSSYQKYMLDLVRKYHLEDHIEFLGHLGPEQMKQQFLNANVFVLPSTIENSPNSLGEAMLLGVPCVASDVGGVSTMMVHEKEGYIYQSTAPYMLAHYIKKVFSLEDKAEEMGLAAKLHAQKTHDPDTNLNRLLEIYGELAGR